MVLCEAPDSWLFYHHRSRRRPASENDWVWSLGQLAGWAICRHYCESLVEGRGFSTGNWERNSWRERSHKTEELQRQKMQREIFSNVKVKLAQIKSKNNDGMVWWWALDLTNFELQDRIAFTEMWILKITCLNKREVTPSDAVVI